MDVRNRRRRPARNRPESCRTGGGSRRGRGRRCPRDAARQPLRSASSHAPTQAELRRSISTAYDALFHTAARAGADLFVGPEKRQTVAYALIYRSFPHGRVKSICTVLEAATLNMAMQQQLRRTGVSRAARAIANAFIDLQDRRHPADYDPQEDFLVSKASDQIAVSEAAIADFEAIPADE